MMPSKREDLQPRNNAQPSKNLSPSHSRRVALKRIAVGTGVAAGVAALPGKWVKPMVDKVLVPAHAQTSTTTTPDPCGIDCIFEVKMDWSAFSCSWSSGSGGIPEVADVELEVITPKMTSVRRDGQREGQCIKVGSYDGPPNTREGSPRMGGGNIVPISNTFVSKGRYQIYTHLHNTCGGSVNISINVKACANEANLVKLNFTGTRFWGSINVTTNGSANIRLIS